MPAFYFYIRRAKAVCSSPESFNRELLYIRAVAKDRGYPPPLYYGFHHFKFSPPETSQYSGFLITLNCFTIFPSVSFKVASILRKFDFNVAFSPFAKLAFSSLKDPVPPEQRWGIYKIDCQCDMCYIGQTSRALKFRIREYIRSVGNKDLRLAVAQHAWENDHCFRFAEAKVIFHPNNTSELDFAEGFFYHLNKLSSINAGFAVPPLLLRVGSLSQI